MRADGRLCTRADRVRGELVGDRAAADRPLQHVDVAWHDAEITTVFPVLSTRCTRSPARSGNNVASGSEPSYVGEALAREGIKAWSQSRRMPSSARSPR